MHTSITVETTDRVSVHDITDDVSDAIPVEVGQGICTVFVPHTTAGVTVNEAETRLIDDVESILTDLVPTGEGYGHDEVDDNADAHLRSMLLGSSVTIPITTGDVNLGTWQSILLFEGDGPRTRTVEIAVVPA